jgi:hypothetical protein
MLTPRDAARHNIGGAAFVSIGGAIGDDVMHCPSIVQTWHLPEFMRGLFCAKSNLGSQIGGARRRRHGLHEMH